MYTEEQFTQLAEQYMDTVFRLAFSYLKSPSDADDVTQNVLLSLFTTNKNFESSQHLKHWLIRVTINECRKFWRSPWRRLEDYSEYIDKLVFEEKCYSDLFQSIMDLDKKCRAVIVLYYYEGYSIAEISTLLDVPPGTVGTRLKRAKSKLKDYLTEAYRYE